VAKVAEHLSSKCEALCSNLSTEGKEKKEEEEECRLNGYVLYAQEMIHKWGV
jgi:hypothetical protein